MIQGLTEAQSEASTRLLEAVQDVAPLLRASSSQSEDAGTLAPEAVSALREAGLFRMRLMRELGGLEVSINTQIDVLAELASIDTAAAWCTMVANNGVASIGAYMPDSTVDIVFADGVPICAGVAAPAGRAEPADGGYRISGTWKFASGIRHAEWVFLSTLVEGDPSRPLMAAVRTSNCDIHDSWHVLGLKGTGSCDFSLVDVFVPAELTNATAQRVQLRGTRLYARTGVILAVYEHLAIAVGLAKRALRELSITLAERTAPGATRDRETVCAELSRLTIQVDAVIESAHSYYEAIERNATAELDPIMGAKGRALASWATEIADQCAQVAFKRAGGRALYCPNPFEQMKRDIAAAQAHVLVNDSSFAVHGTALIEAATLEGTRR